MLAALSGVLLTTLLARLLLSAAVLAALSRVLLTTLLARLLLSATLLAATLALLARLLFTRVHNGSFVGPPTYNETLPSKVPWAWKAKRPQPHRNLSSEMTVA
jgi:hypothetical protein